MGIAAGAVRKPGIPDDQAEALLLSARMDKKFAEDFGTVCFRRVQKPPKLLSDLARPAGIEPATPAFGVLQNAPKIVTNQCLAQLANCKIKAKQGHSRPFEPTQTVLSLYSP
jgi:hypothetical protein